MQTTSDEQQQHSNSQSTAAQIRHIHTCLAQPIQYQSSLTPNRTWICNIVTMPIAKPPMPLTRSMHQYTGDKKKCAYSYSVSSSQYAISGRNNTHAFALLYADKRYLSPNSPQSPVA